MSTQNDFLTKACARLASALHKALRTSALDAESEPARPRRMSAFKHVLGIVEILLRRILFILALQTGLPVLKPAGARCPGTAPQKAPPLKPRTGTRQGGFALLPAQSQTGAAASGRSGPRNLHAKAPRPERLQRRLDTLLRILNDPMPSARRMARLLAKDHAACLAAGAGAPEYRFAPVSLTPGLPSELRGLAGPLADHAEAALLRQRRDSS